MATSLNTLISKVTRLSGEHIFGLKKLKIETILDLLYYFPTRYADERENRNINDLAKGQAVILFGVIKNIKIKRSFHGHIPMTEAKLVDNSGSLKLVWFHQAYIGKMYQENDFVKISGVVAEKDGVFSMMNPQIERSNSTQNLIQENIFNLENFGAQSISQELIPIYRETKGVSSNFLNYLIKKCLKELKVLDLVRNIDPVPKNILKELNLPSLDKAFLYIHLPKSQKDFSTEKQIISARKRFSFQEIFFIQIEKQRERELAKNSLAYKIEDNKFSKDFISCIQKKYNFKLTSSQLLAIRNILESLNKVEPMSRLLEGDVGSGKTLVAAAAVYVISQNENKLQVAYMAPTEILAKQHFESFINYFADTGIEIGLLTSKSCYKFPSKLQNQNRKTQEDNFYTQISKPQLKKQIALGNISILIGTHSLIQKNLFFKSLALVIIDEQHRFGVKQRAALAQKKSVEINILPANDLNNLKNKKEKIFSEKRELPHLLTMTATPIPRTLALTIFGDLDLTVIDEMPRNRKKILTKIVLEKDRGKIYEEIKSEIVAGYQAYVITPRIDELDEEEKQSKNKLNLRSVQSELKSIKKYFGDKISVAGLHGNLKKDEKEKIMEDFSKNKIQILVATSVVEVGVNVPNASRMIIEGAERFGLAQLHQLRGRIGRSDRESICYLFTTNGNIMRGSEITAKRLKALEDAKNGFELAERDMQERGIGTLQNGKQWGLSDLAMEAIKNLKLVEVARESAKKIIFEDPNLEKIEHNNLKNILLEKDKVHME